MKALAAAAAFLLVLVLPAIAHGQCAEQAPSVIAYDGQLRVCTPENTPWIEVLSEREAVIEVIVGPFLAGEVSDPQTIQGCGENDVLTGRSCNEAGCGEWGPQVDATFPPCWAPIFTSVPRTE